ncbi:MAG: NTP transferase domain-containing protein [Gemmatimonadetes bacterium]|nr:NTP transferase domain-containing protein [Gemmatimonadota bacterium]
MTQRLFASTQCPPAVILAAGQGMRMDSEVPKPLTQLLGQSLIERAIRVCASVGVRQFVVVVGHQQDQVCRHVYRLGDRLGLDVSCATAHNWSMGNGASTGAAASHLRAQPFFLLMADHLVDPEILKKLLADPPASDEVCLAVDRNHHQVFDLNDATRVRCVSGRVADIGKELAEWDSIDTGTFLCGPEIFLAIEKARIGGRHQLSDAITELASRGVVRPIDVTGCRWLDVDTPETLVEAERQLLSSLNKGGQDGFVSQWINRPLSIRLSKYLVRTGVTPNEITVASFLMSLIGAVFLAAGGYAAGVLGGLLIQAASVIDGCDGEIARLKGMATPRGAWLDTMLDRYADIAITLAIVTAYVRHATAPGVLPVTVGIVAATGFILASYVTKEFARHHTLTYPHDFLDRMKHRDLRLLVISVGALVGFPYQALILVGVLSHAFVVGIMLRGWRLSPILAEAPDNLTLPTVTDIAGRHVRYRSDAVQVPRPPLTRKAMVGRSAR